MESSKQSGPVFEPYESEQEVLANGLSFQDAFQTERIGWSGKHAALLIVLIVIALSGVLALILFLPHAEGSVVFSEVMSSNGAAYVHPVYGAVDWVELYNPTDHDIDLSGFGMTDELKKQYKYQFPVGTVLKSGEYLVLWCTGGTTATDADPYCTGFALSQEGETLYLIDRSYFELDELTFPALETDVAYARTDSGAFQATAIATPGEANVFTE